MKSMPLQRTSLKDQAVTLLRGFILSGELPPGTRLVERDLAEQLGVSRVPVRDALLYLEAEGLVESDSHGRRVISLDQQALTDLYQVRAALEELAVTLAARHRTPDMLIHLRACLQTLQQAAQQGDPGAISQADVALHKALWQASGNLQLQRSMQSLAGPIFMFAALHARRFDWEPALRLHERIIDSIEQGDAAGALASMRAHLQSFRERAEQILA